MTEQKEKSIDVEAIMQQIRAEILAQKQAHSVGDSLHVRLDGKRFPPEFYEYLYQANMEYDQIQVMLQLQKSTVPFVGPLIDRLKKALHQLVLFYVQQLAVKQMEVNRNLLGALNSLSQAFDDETREQAAAE